jgi:hypothetical protein
MRCTLIMIRAHFLRVTTLQYYAFQLTNQPPLKRTPPFITKKPDGDTVLLALSWIKDSLPEELNNPYNPLEGGGVSERFVILVSTFREDQCGELTLVVYDDIPHRNVHVR